MPELPDLTIVAEAFHAALAGRSVTRAEAPAPLAVRGTPAELAALVGQRVERIARRGKFLVIDLDRDAIVVNPMLTGRFQLAAPAVKHPTKTAVVLAFGERGGAGAKGRPADAARWTAGASLDAGRRRAGRGALPRPDPDGQGLPPPGRSRPADPGPGR